MKIISLFHLLGAAQGCFLTLVMLFWRRGNRQANLLVSAIFFMMTVALWNSYLITSGLYATLTFSIRWYDVLRLLTGPLVYLYVREMTAKPLVMKDALHFVPACIYAIILMPFFFGPTEEKIRFIEQTLEGKSSEYIWFSAIRPFYNLFYLILALRLLRDYSRRIREIFASLELVSLQWLWYIVLGTTLLIALVALASIAALFGIVRPNQINSSVAIVAFLWVYGMAFYALRSNLINSDDLRQLLADIPPNFNHANVKVHDYSVGNDFRSNGNSQISNSQMSNSQGNIAAHNGKILDLNESLIEKRMTQFDRKTTLVAEYHAEEIRRRMEEQKLYLDSQLNLQKFAESLGIPAHRVSEILNKELGTNFFDFVNRYRVEEWKRQIINASPSITIQEVAYMVGFNSKSSFYSAFKKFTGQTPTEYRGQ